jgi:hypothetical protein
MGHKFRAFSEMFFAAGEKRVHSCNLGLDSIYYYVVGQATRARDLGRLAAGRHVSEGDDDRHAEAVFERLRASQLSIFFQTTLATLHRAEVAQVEMFEHLHSIPLSFRMAREFFGGHSIGCGREGLLQLE